MKKYQGGIGDIVKSRPIFEHTKSWRLAETSGWPKSLQLVKCRKMGEKWLENIESDVRRNAYRKIFRQVAVSYHRSE